MSWPDHAIFWQVYPLGMAGAPPRAEGAEPGPRLRRLLPWLDHIVGLGCSGLLLNPVFASTSHGYDTVDFSRIDPRLGTDEDFDALVAACRERGLRIVLDGVFNHVGRDHALFRAALEGGPDSPEARLFRIDFTREEHGEPAWHCFEGHRDLVTLNHDAPEVADLVVDAMCRWLERGADGWRLDAAYAVPPEFWQRVLPRVRERFPEAWIVGEVIHGDYADIVQRSGMDSVTQYELWKAIWSSLHDGNLFEFDWGLQRHAEFCAVFTPLTFVGNHDVTRIASKVGEPLARLAVTVLMTVAGVPAVYYGDEFAYRGVKEERAGGDDQIRPPLPDTPDDVTLGHGMRQLHQDLIAIRRRNPWLVAARTERLELANERMVYRASNPGGDDELVVELQLGAAPSARITQGGAELLRV
ncbi:MAG: alpha-amylase family protein [Micrococcales bacterium]|nr:alpha-amylase family protein [Micrococcales bacterium]